MLLYNEEEFGRGGYNSKQTEGSTEILLRTLHINTLTYDRTLLTLI